MLTTPRTEAEQRDRLLDPDDDPAGGLQRLSLVWFKAERVVSVIIEHGLADDAMASQYARRWYSWCTGETMVVGLLTADRIFTELGLHISLLGDADYLGPLTHLIERPAELVAA